MIRIGLIGIVIDANKKPWVNYLPPVESAKSAVADLKGKVDAIVALTHLALAGDADLATKVPEIDLILGATSTKLEMRAAITSRRSSSATPTCACGDRVDGVRAGRGDRRQRAPADHR